MKVKIETKGLQELRRGLNKKSVEIDEAGIEGLKAAGVKIGRDAEMNLVNNRSVATGQIRKHDVLVKGNEVDVIFKSLHASAVEFGRRAGKQPPIDNILEWIKKKGIVDTYSIKTRKQTSRGKNFYKKAAALAFLIARKIGKFGVKARPFLYPAFRQNEDEVMKILTNSIKKKL